MMGTMLSRPKFANFYLPNVQLSKLQNKKMVVSYSQASLPKEHEGCYYKTYNLNSKKQMTEQSLKSIAPIQVDSIKLLTYNVWFQSHNQQKRIYALLDIIKKSDANVICLQEVNAKFREALHKNASYLCDGKDLFMPLITMHWYDTLILTRFPLKFFKIPFQMSYMQRCDLIGLCSVKSEGQNLTLSFNCVHLQSLQSEEARIAQLKLISQINKDFQLVCIAGDFNFSDNWNQDKILQKQYLDLWKWSQQEKKTSWTMPKTSKFSQWRPDHVVLQRKKIQNKQFNKILNYKIQRVGDFTIQPFHQQKVEDIKKDGVVRTPSDHIGLLANFRF